jgi:hypothetical protein
MLACQFENLIRHWEHLCFFLNGLRCPRFVKVRAGTRIAASAIQRSVKKYVESSSSFIQYTMGVLTFACFNFD